MSERVDTELLRSRQRWKIQRAWMSGAVSLYFIIMAAWEVGNGCPTEYWYFAPIWAGLFLSYFVADLRSLGVPW